MLKTKELNRFSDDSKETVQKLGKIELFELGEVYNRIQALTRKTVMLHLRNMLNGFNGAEVQDQKSIRDLVHAVLYREEGSLPRCKAGTDPMAIWSLQSERNNSKREKERIRFHFAKVARWRPIPKFSNCRRMDWRILSICGFALVNWFLAQSYKKRAWNIWEQSYSWRQRSRNKVGTDKEPTRFLTSNSPPHRDNSRMERRIRTFPNNCGSDNVQWRKNKIGTSMDKLELEQLVTIFFLFNLVDATRMARIGTWWTFSKVRRSSMMFSTVSLTSTSDSPCKRRECQKLQRIARI